MWAASGRDEPGAGVRPLSDSPVIVQFCTVKLSVGSREQGSEGWSAALATWWWQLLHPLSRTSRKMPSCPKSKPTVLRFYYRIRRKSVAQISRALTEEFWNACTRCHHSISDFSERFFLCCSTFKSWLFLFSIYNQCKKKSFFPLLSEMIPDDFSLAFLFLLIFPLLEFKVINISSVWLKLLSLQSSRVCLKQYDNSKGKQFK